jgi:spermidine/putrescine transport system ATP-binding protein
MTTDLVEVKNISHWFGSAKVLDNVSLTIAPGSYTILLGPSGSGKTTLLSILGGFLVPSDGRVIIGGRDCTDVPPAQRPTTTVFQDYALFPHMTVANNVGFGLRMKGVAKTERMRRALEMLTLVGLAESFNKKPHELSGGQRQRVVLARALVVEPSVLLLDEPLGALDLKLRRQMQDELKAIQKRVGTAFVHVTHDQEEAMALADHCIVMNQGRIEDEGAPERVYARPATRFSATFMGESTLISGKVAKAEGDVVTVMTAFGLLPLAAVAQPGASVTLAVRPENLQLRRDSRTISFGTAKVSSVTFQGSFKRIIAESDMIQGQSFFARTAAGFDVAIGDTVTPCCHPQDLILLAS